MTCPICKKRKAKRFCPAKARNICSVCCGTEREVTIDCPLDCPYLVASRQYDSERREIDWSKIPFADTRIPSSFVEAQEKLLTALCYAILLSAREQRSLVDSDVLTSLQSLAETYRTLSSGLYYEKPPVYGPQRELYEKLKATVEEFKKTEAQRTGFTGVRDGDVRDGLIFLTQLAATRANGRPKGRAYLDFVRTQFSALEPPASASNILLLP